MSRKPVAHERKYNYEDKFVFVGEMYDSHSDSIKNLVLYFYPFDNSLKVIDVGKGKLLLSRTECPKLKLDNFKIGQTILVFAKLIYIKDCDERTRHILFSRTQSTFAFIKPMDPKEYGKILNFIISKGFRIAQMKNTRIHKDFCKILYKNSRLPNLPSNLDGAFSNCIPTTLVSAENTR